MARSKQTVLGVISDTHGPLPTGAARALAGADHIICAGDIMTDQVLPALHRIAPAVTAVRGNMDAHQPTRTLPLTEVADVGGVLVYVLHDLNRLDLDPAAAGFAAVVHGHTHRASIQFDDGVLYLNPGTAGDPRHGRAATVARVVIQDGRLTPEIVEI